MKFILKNLLLFFITILLFSYCEKTKEFNESEESFELRAKNGQKGKPNPDDGEGTPGAIYEIQFSGNLITSPLLYGEVEKDGNRSGSMDFFVCGNQSLSGIGSLNTCWENEHCARFYGLSHFDKTNYPDRVKSVFWFKDSNTGKNGQFSMWGSLSHTIDNNWSMYPTDTLDILTITFDKFKIHASKKDKVSSSCLEDNRTFAPDYNNQSLTIRLLSAYQAENVCADAVTCVYEP